MYYILYHTTLIRFDLSWVDSTRHPTKMGLYAVFLFFCLVLQSCFVWYLVWFLRGKAFFFSSLFGYSSTLLIMTLYHRRSTIIHCYLQRSDCRLFCFFAKKTKNVSLLRRIFFFFFFKSTHLPLFVSLACNCFVWRFPAAIFENFCLWSYGILRLRCPTCDVLFCIPPPLFPFCGCFWFDGFR